VDIGDGRLMLVRKRPQILDPKTATTTIVE
jgi:hypothetical protein